MKIPVISAEQLRPVLGRVLGSPDATPLSWSYEPLGVDLVNPSTAGLYRVTGNRAGGRGSGADLAGDREGQPPSRLHRDAAGTRVCRAADGLELLEARGTRLHSGIPERFSSPLRPVRCWAVEDVEDTTAWLWLEDLEATTDGPRWSLDGLAASAYDWVRSSTVAHANAGDGASA